MSSTNNTGDRIGKIGAGTNEKKTRLTIRQELQDADKVIALIQCSLLSDDLDRDSRTGACILLDNVRETIKRTARHLAS